MFLQTLRATKSLTEFYGLVTLTKCLTVRFFHETDGQHRRVAFRWASHGGIAASSGESPPLRLDRRDQSESAERIERHPPEQQDGVEATAQRARTDAQNHPRERRPHSKVCARIFPTVSSCQIRVHIVRQDSVSYCARPVARCVTAVLF